MAEKWVTVKKAAEIVGRSHHTVYNWIERTRRGKASPSLLIKHSEKENGKGWLINVKSLRKVNKNSARASRPRLIHRPIEQPSTEVGKISPSKFAGTRSCFKGGDSMKRVTADRRKWIKTWVDEGMTLTKVLSIFAPKLHQEIERLYRDEIKSRRRTNGT